MVNYETWLNYVKDGIINENERYQVIDNSAILDTLSGVKLHFYDEWLKITHNDEIVATTRDFNPDTEQPIMWDIRELITDPEKVKNHMKYVEEHRERLSVLLQNPTPVNNITQGDDDYIG